MLVTVADMYTDNEAMFCVDFGVEVVDAAREVLRVGGGEVEECFVASA